MVANSRRPARQLCGPAGVEGLLGIILPQRGKAMNQNKQPSKESVRQWLQTQIAERRPPPDAQQIRRELGWEMLKMERKERGQR
ncbi:hypothetical protein [Duganella caerulea]|uniref:hypothetical protein n=1 Tax=Duganella caerulea TaxID=2885762 RepID=UPI004037AD0F